MDMAYVNGMGWKHEVKLWELNPETLKIDNNYR